MRSCDVDGLSWLNGFNPDYNNQDKPYKFSCDDLQLIEYWKYGIEFTGLKLYGKLDLQSIKSIKIYLTTNNLVVDSLEVTRDIIYTPVGNDSVLIVTLVSNLVSIDF